VFDASNVSRFRNCPVSQLAALSPSGTQQNKSAARPHPARRCATLGGRAFGVRVQLPPLKSIIHWCFPKANIYARVQNGVVAGIGRTNILCKKAFALYGIIVYRYLGSLIITQHK
jgi:hypothetical protein